MEGFHHNIIVVHTLLASFIFKNTQKKLLQISSHDFFGASLTELSDFDADEVCLYSYMYRLAMKNYTVMTY